MSFKGWIAVDLDGTLAYYVSGQWPKIGAPIMPMVERIKRWLAEGKEVRIMTARVSGADWRTEDKRVRAYCLEHIGQELEVTCRKDFDMIEQWDDRAVQVIPNTGRTIADELKAERSAKAGKP
jgi:hypothetical protein